MPEIFPEDDMKEIVAHIKGHIAEHIEEVGITPVQELQLVAKSASIQRVMAFLRDDPLLHFHQLMDLCGVDYLEKKPRFAIAYHLLSLPNNMRIRVKAYLHGNTGIDSISGIFANADWYERECFDMYGIAFTGHADMRRLLTDYGFEGWPLRKDFPLSGHVELRYDEERQQVVQEKIDLTQSFRDFDYQSPWEGVITSAMRGDKGSSDAPSLGTEKAQTKPAGKEKDKED